MRNQVKASLNSPYEKQWWLKTNLAEVEIVKSSHSCNMFFKIKLIEFAVRMWN